MKNKKNTKAAEAGNGAKAATASEAANASKAATASEDDGKRGCGIFQGECPVLPAFLRDGDLLPMAHVLDSALVR